MIREIPPFDAAYRAWRDSPSSALKGNLTLIERNVALADGLLEYVRFKKFLEQELKTRIYLHPYP